MVIPFDDKGGSALAHNGAIAVKIEWAARALGILGPRQTVEQAEFGDIDRMNIRAGGADDHAVGGTAANDAHGFRQCQ